MALARDRISYSVGSEHNPGDPFGRSMLSIEVDGRSRLEQFTKAGQTEWTGVVTAGARDDIWAALEEAQFPDVPEHDVPPGSAIRTIRIGQAAAHIAYHEVETMRGYRDACFYLDVIIRQLSEDTVRAGGEYATPLVESIHRVGSVAAPALTPATAFALGYLPGRRLAHVARVSLVERNATTIDQDLKHAIEFSRKALDVEESMADDADERIATLAKAAGLTLPPVPKGVGSHQWLVALDAAVGPRLTTPVVESAWKAGESARSVAVHSELAAHIAYLRCAAPANPDLREQAATRASWLKESAAELETHLRATKLPLVVSNADAVPQMIGLTSDLEPTDSGGFAQLNELVRDLRNFMEAHIRDLDAQPPAAPSSPPTAEEEALLSRILAEPGNHALRGDLAKLAERRNDARAQLIRLQLSDGTRQQAHDLVQSHPEWTAPLAQLGARDIKFEVGFPAEITIDAATWLSRGKDLIAAAPLTRVHVRNAKGRVREVVQSPLLATIEALDLDNQGVTDDDLQALVTSPHAARLRQLDLRYNPISARGIDAIAAHLKRLEVVSLDGNPDDPVDRVEYSDDTNHHRVPTEAGKALEAKYGRLRWLHPG